MVPNSGCIEFWNKNVTNVTQDNLKMLTIPYTFKSV